MDKVYFATNRNYKKDENWPKTFGERFHADGPEEFRVGWATVEDNGNGGYEIDESQFYIAPEANGPGSKKIFTQLQEKMRNREGDVLVYLHGFASPFETCLKRAAELRDKYSVDGQNLFVFAFSWPADDRLLINTSSGPFPKNAYKADRADAKASGIAMAKAMIRLIEFIGQDNNCKRDIHLVAHSMGNWALRHALQGFEETVGRDAMRIIFTNAFLMAADEDHNALECEEKLGLLFRVAKRIHVYHASDDTALYISDWTKGNVDRLGTDGPSSLSALPRNRVIAVDCGDVSDPATDRWTRHQYYRLRKEVLEDVRQVLNGTHPDKVKKRDRLSERSYRIQSQEG